MKDPLRFILISAVSLAGVNTIWSQTDEEVILLDPFVVSTSDSGYQARNSLSATKFDIEVKSVPISITSLTQEFLGDTYSQTLEDAVRFSAGITRSPSVSAEEGGGFYIRGLRTGRSKRNGIVQLYTQDMTNVSKVEVVKGPMSLLYGQVEPGGLINYLTMNAYPETRTDLKFVYGSHDHYRAQLNHTGPILEGDKNEKGRLLYRVDASYKSEEGWRSNTEDERTFTSLLLEYKPTAKTTVELQWDRLNQNSFNAAPLPKINKAWREIWLELVEERTPDEYFQLHLLAPQNPFDGANPSKENSLIGFFGTELLTIDTPNATPRLWDGYADWWDFSLNFVPQDAFNDVLMDIYSLELRQQLFNSWYAKLYIVHNEINRESKWGNIWGIGVSGEVGPGYSSNHWDRYNSDTIYQLEITGKWNLGITENQTIVGFEYMDLNYDSFLATGQAINLVRPDIYTEILANPLNNPYFNATSLSPTNLGDLRVGTTREDLTPQFAEIRKSKSAFISNVSRMFNDRLLILTGIRYDDLSVDSVSGAGEQKKEDTATSPQVGISYQLVDSFTLYSSYSKSFVPQAGTQEQIKSDDEIAEVFRTVANPTSRDFVNSIPRESWLGSGYEVGGKFEFFEGKVSGSFAYFHTELDGIETKLARRLEGINANGQTVVKDVRISSSANGREVDGFELELFIKPFPGMQTVISYSYLDSTDIVRFVKTDGSLGSLSTPSVTVPDHQVGFWSKYTFEDGALDGFSIGGGFNWSDERYGAFALNADNPNPEVVTGGLEIEESILLDQQITFELIFGYSFDLKNIEYDIQLNVKNLFDERFILPGGMPNDPLSLYLSLQLHF